MWLEPIIEWFNHILAKHFQDSIRIVLEAVEVMFLVDIRDVFRFVATVELQRRAVSFSNEELF